ncbi:hypothetical protein Bbelb_370190 [Branchiostoma belcheri]|nr:hypothetical protein Bbelb_370190 [Branchiostoma belcheri]
MLYNCNSWAAPRTVIEKLDTCHRKHLRAITGLQWPKSRVTNGTLYKVCDTEPLSVKVEKLRWSLFGHILRMPQDTPAQKALEFSFLSPKRYKARRGRHCINLLSLLKGDLKRRELGPPTIEKKLNELRELAKQKARLLKRRRLGPPTTEKKLKELRELAKQKARWRDDERLNAATGHFYQTVDAEHSE